MPDKPAQLVNLTFQPRPQLSGPLASFALQRVAQEEIRRDLQELSDAVNINSATLSREINTRLADLRGVRSFVDEMDSDDQAKRIAWAYSGVFPPIAVSMNRLSGPSHLAEWDESGNTYFSDAASCRMDTRYGQVLLPYDVVANAVYGIDSRTGSVRLPSNVNTTVNVVTAGGTSIPGNPKQAFDGKESSYWLHKVRFPMESDVKEVEITIQLDLPRDFASDVNLISVDPYPVGLLDITAAQYSTTTADPSTTLTGFTEVRDASHKRWHFASLAMTKFKLTLKQRNWVEEDGWKVFHVGLREVRFELVKFASGADTNGIVFKMTAPEGLRWNELTRFHSSPTPSNGAVSVKAYSDVSLSTEVWDSDDGLPQDIGDIDIGTLQDFWLKFTLDVQDDGTSPILEWFSIDHTLEDSDGNALGNAGVTGAALVTRTSFIPASSFAPTTTSGCTGPFLVELGTNKVDTWVLRFADGSDTYGIADWFVPPGYAGGKITAQVMWTNTSGGGASVGETIEIEVALASYGDGDDTDRAFSGAQPCTDAVIGDEYHHTTGASAPITPTGTPAGGEQVRVRLMRDESASTITGGIDVLGVRLTYLTTVSDA